MAAEASEVMSSDALCPTGFADVEWQGKWGVWEICVPQKNALDHEQGPDDYD